MLDGIWRVYATDGNFLAMGLIDVGNEVLDVGNRLGRFHVGDMIHMDEIYSKKAWIVIITGKGKGSSEFKIRKIGDRASQYEVPPKKSILDRFYLKRKKRNK